eukprot:scaffold83874_cov30-Tisochrysis_lutea.AAC.2
MLAEFGSVERLAAAEPWKHLCASHKLCAATTGQKLQLAGESGPHAFPCSCTCACCTLFAAL